MGIKQKLVDYKTKNLMTESIPFKEQLGFAVGSFGQSMEQDCSSTYSEKFQREFVGINNNKILIKDNVTTIAGFFIPPLAGAFYDSLNSKRSNIKFGLRTAPVLFTVASLLMFIVPQRSPLFNLVWVIVLGLGFNIGESFYGIAMNVLALKLLHKNPQDRKKFYTLSSLAKNIGSMLPGWIMSLLLDVVKGSSQEKKLYFLVALIFCSMGFIAMYAPSMTIDMTRSIFFQPVEKTQTEKASQEKICWNKKNIGLILHNRPFLIVQLVTLCESVRRVAFENLMFFFHNVLDKSGMKALTDMLSGSLAYVGLFLFPVLCTKYPAHKIAAGGYSYSALFYFIISLFNVGSLNGSLGFVGNHGKVLESIRRRRWIIGLLIGLSGMPNYTQSAAKDLVVADSTDYMEWYAEKNYGEPMQNDGLLLAAQGLIGKISDLTKKNLSGILFKIVKFREGQNGQKVVQSDATLRGIFSIVAICGCVGNLLAAICFLFDNYTGDRKQKILEELAEFRKARAALEAQMHTESVTV